MLYVLCPFVASVNFSLLGGFLVVPVDTFCRSFCHCTLVQLGAEYLDFCISFLFLMNICSICLYVPRSHTTIKVLYKHFKHIESTSYNIVFILISLTSCYR